MIKMKTRIYFTILFLLVSFPVFSQYLPNPSFEGTILMIGPPPEWDICIDGSTPNVQPGKYSVYLPPSDGITYVGLLTRENNTWEDMNTTLNIPLSKDSCYIFKIDLAYQAQLSFTYTYPIILRIYGNNVSCEKDNILWQSPAIANEDWLTYEFLIHNEDFDITELIIESYFTGIIPYWGYALLDNIRIEATPKFELGNDTTLTLCSNDSLILDPGNGFSNYLWQDGSQEQTYSVDTTGLYWVQAFNGAGCSWTDSIYVTVEEYLPMLSNMLDSTLLCSGQEVTITAEILNGSEPYSYQWEDLIDTTGSITVIADTTMYYYVLVTDNCGETLMDSIKLVVIADPEINLGNDTLICSDGNYELHAGGGFIQYQWQNGSGDSVITVTEPGIYWVEVTSVFGCSARDSITIDLFPAIPLNIGNDTTLCIGDSLLLNAGSGLESYQWQNSSTDSAITVNSTGIYWVTVTDLNGCHATDSIEVQFLETPEIDLGADLEICEGDDLTITPGPGYISYLWQDGDTSQYYPVSQSGTYWVTVNNGCGEDTDTIYIEAYPEPQPDLGPDTTICNGAGLLLDPGSQYTSYLWQDNSVLPFYSVNSAGTYTVIVENNYGCLGEDEIYVNYSNSTINLGGDQNICEGETTDIDAGEGFQSYQWQDNSTGQTYTITQAGTYSVIAEDEYGCEIGDTVVYSYYPYPNPDLGPDQNICEGDTTYLQAPEGEYLYYWNGEAGEQSYAVSTTGEYTLSMVNPCDSVSSAIEVSVTPLPEVYLGEDDILLPGQTIELDAGAGFDEYLWQDGSGSQYYIITENNINADEPYYSVLVTEGVCTGIDSIKIELFQVWVPQVITPNGDNENDSFQADTERWAGVNQHTMMVFNRWGEKVWESDNFVTGWDGKQNGKYVSEGTYYWILEVYYGKDNVKQVLKGSLTVIGVNQN